MSNKAKEITLDDVQKSAVDMAVKKSFSIINGGAGMGKTEIVKFIANKIESRGETVLMCAFAGKAAARLREATGKPASTIHRLLMSNGHTFNAETFEGKTIIIDEASMVSSDLMAEICQRKPKRLILVGDQSQLPPVGKGQPFHDLIEAIPESIKTLETCYRNSAAVFDASMEIREGRMPEMLESYGDEHWEVCKAATPGAVHNIIMENVKSGSIDFEQDIILCPRNGDNEEHVATVKGLNKSIVDIVNPREFDEKFLIGDRVMLTKNFTDSDVYNGNCGTVHSIANVNEMYIRLDVPTGDGESIIKFDRDMIKETKLAYAMTVHKAQGSQARTVIFCCMARDSHALLDRSLIYTAVTRATKNCVVVGQVSALKFGIKNVRKKTTCIQELSKK